MNTGSSTANNEPIGTSESVPISVDVEEPAEKATTTRAKKSKVWQDMKTIKDANGKERAVCNHCKKTFVGNSKSGTSHLASHLKRCTVKIYNSKGQPTLATMISTDGAVKVEAFKFSQDRSRTDLAKMVVKHNYPFNMAEHEFFENFCSGLQPEFRLPSRNTVRSDVIKLHGEMKVKVYELLDDLDSRVTLTTDIWTSDSQNFAYAALTAHYITSDWELCKKILNYRYISYPHDGESLFRFISQLVMEWNLDKKLFSMVVDNAASNDCMARHLKTWLSDRIPCGGDFFHVRCSAHILNLVAQDGLALIKPFLDNIRGTVRYLSKSPYGKQKFDQVVLHLKMQGKRKIPMDVSTRWNSTFEMLDIAIEYEEAFDRLAFMDKNYVLNPGKEEWKIARTVHGCFKIFSDATVHFSGTTYPTANVFFPDICEINLQLAAWENHPEQCFREMVVPMRIKFSKYWDECCICLAVAVVLDPRFKMDIIEYYYDKLYGKDRAYAYVQKVKSAFFDLYIEYGGRIISSESSLADGGYDELISSTNVQSEVPQKNKLNDFKMWRQRERDSGIRHAPKSEFDQYLDEDTHPCSGKFNILTWWLVNGTRFPTISKIARDILAIPATTVASESAFSIGGRVIDESRSCLLPDIVEALICTADWIPSRKQANTEEFQNERGEADKIIS